MERTSAGEVLSSGTCRNDHEPSSDNNLSVTMIFSGEPRVKRRKVAEMRAVRWNYQRFSILSNLVAKSIRTYIGYQSSARCLGALEKIQALHAGGRPAADQARAA